MRNYLGLALIPQAGVAIGLAAMGARTLGGETGRALETIVLASSVLYELIGPACAKLSLYLSHSYSTKLEELVPEPLPEDAAAPPTEVERIIARIHAIQAELPRHEDPYYEDEKAYYSLEILKKVENNEYRYSDETIKNFNKIIKEWLS